MYLDRWYDEKSLHLKVSLSKNVDSLQYYKHEKQEKTEWIDNESKEDYIYFIKKELHEDSSL